MSTDDFTVRMDELNTLATRVGVAGFAAPAKAAMAVAKTAHDIEGTAKTFVPVDTGATKNSIHVATTDGRALGLNALVAVIGPTTHYAPHLEYGTVKMAPHAFMGPALDRHAPDLRNALGQLGAQF